MSASVLDELLDVVDENAERYKLKHLRGSVKKSRAELQQLRGDAAPVEIKINGVSKVVDKQTAIDLLSAQLRADNAAFADLLVYLNAASAKDAMSAVQQLRADLQAAQQRIAALEAAVSEAHEIIVAHRGYTIDGQHMKMRDLWLAAHPAPAAGPGCAGARHCRGA